MKVNVNQECLIRENTDGVQAFNNYYHALGLDPEVYRKMALQPDGRMLMQLWRAMAIYGPALSIGMNPAINPTIEIED